MSRTAKEAKVWGRHLTRAAEKSVSAKAASKPSAPKFRLSSSLRDEIARSPFSTKKTDKFRKKSSSPRLSEQRNEENRDPGEETEKEENQVDAGPVLTAQSSGDVELKTKLKVVVRKNDGESRFMRTFSSDKLEERSVTHAIDFDENLVSKLAEEDGVYSPLRSPTKPAVMTEASPDHESMDEDDDYEDEELPEDGYDDGDCSDDEELDFVCGSPVGMTVDDVRAADGDIIPRLDLGSDSGGEESDASSSWESEEEEAEEVIDCDDVEDEYLPAALPVPEHRFKVGRKLDEQHLASVPGPSSKRPKLLSENFVRLNIRNKKSMTGASKRSKAKMKQFKIEKRFFRRVSSLAAQAGCRDDGDGEPSTTAETGDQKATSTSSTASFKKPAPYQTKKRGKCFSCGKSGHWIADCPLRHEPFAETAAENQDDEEVMEMENCDSRMTRFPGFCNF